MGGTSDDEGGEADVDGHFVVEQDRHTGKDTDCCGIGGFNGERGFSREGQYRV